MYAECENCKRNTYFDCLLEKCYSKHGYGYLGVQLILGWIFKIVIYVGLS